MSLEVLLVDDDSLIIFLHKYLAAKSDLSAAPICLGDGKAALDHLNVHYRAENFYLILLDINMPVMNGWEFLDAIQTRPFAHAIAVVMVSSSIDQQDRDRASQYKQVIDFVKKPLTLASCKYIKELAKTLNLY